MHIHICRSTYLRSIMRICEQLHALVSSGRSSHTQVATTPPRLRGPPRPTRSETKQPRSVPGRGNAAQHQLRSAMPSDATVQDAMACDDVECERSLTLWLWPRTLTVTNADAMQMRIVHHEARTLWLYRLSKFGLTIAFPPEVGAT